jgi:hypothetical protein
MVPWWIHSSSGCGRGGGLTKWVVVVVVGERDQVILTADF